MVSITEILLQLREYGVTNPVRSVRASNAAQYLFHLPDFYNISGPVYVGDGAYLVPNDELKAGKKEFFR